MSGELSPVGGLDPARVAQILVEDDSGAGWRGSGYRITSTAVLTAAHVAAGARAVRVVFNADLPQEWSVPATVELCEPAGDVAVLGIDPPQPPHRSVPPAAFGQLGSRAAVLDARAVGFPLFKLKAADQAYRDVHQADGKISALSNWREGTLEITVAAPADDPDPKCSPWAGMSGAAVWCGDRIVGVVSRHHRKDGLNRLTAVRTNRWYQQVTAPALARLRELTGLPASADQLVDVIPVEPGRLITTAYQAQLADIAPAQLQGREPELAELAQFCAGDEPYTWWQAGPWAGKSALLSWFALHPPDGVDVVSFFITSRLAGQSDSTAFTDALVEQLAAFTDESAQTVLASPARRGHALRLLKAAARRCADAGRRLLLVVDGLDEDTSTATGSIASLLPRLLPPEVRVLIASRPHPELPDDVPGDHPLRVIRPRRLGRSPHARDVERTAKTELQRLLHGPAFQREVLGLVTASGGGLTQPDLEELTGRAPYELEGLLGGVFGRTVGGRVAPTPALGRPAEQVYLFTHETLGEIAEQQYGPSLAGYRERLHTWAESYRSRGWPVGTPMYLLRGYPRLLADTSDLPRLLACATERARHDRMLDSTGGDALAFTEIARANVLIAGQPEPDLGALLFLAIARGELAERNFDLPTELPAVWASLGDSARAVALASGLPESDRRVYAFRQLMVAMATAGNHDHIATLATFAATDARKITNPDSRAHVLGALAGTVAAVGDYDRAERLARAITRPDQRDAALRGLAGALAVAGDHDRAERVSYEIINPDDRAQAISELARAAAAGNPARARALAAAAESAAREITDRWKREHSLRALVGPIAAAGDQDRAERLAHEITNPGHRDYALHELSRAIAATGDADRAGRLASEIIELDNRARALSESARACAARDPVGTLALVAVAETTVREITRRGSRDEALSGLVFAVAAAGDHDRAERFSREVISAGVRAQALGGLAAAVAAAGNLDQATGLAAAAESAAREITDPFARGRELSELATTVAAAGDHDRAERLIRENTSRAGRAQALTELAAVVAAAGNNDRAVALAAAAEAAARDSSDRKAHDKLLGRLAAAVAAAGDRVRAERLTRQITDPYHRLRAVRELAKAFAVNLDWAERFAAQLTNPLELREIALAVAATGDYDTAGRISHSIAVPGADQEIADDERAWALREQIVRATAADVSRLTIDTDKTLSEQAEALAAAGDPDHAEQLIRKIIDRAYRARALIAVAGAAAAAGEHARAERLAREITGEGDRARGLIAVVRGIVKSCERNALDQNPTVKTSCTRLLAEVISTSYWQDALPAVGEVGLPTLQHICDTLLAKTTSAPKIREVS